MSRLLIEKDIWIDLFIAVCCVVLACLNFGTSVFYQGIILGFLVMATIFWKMYRQNLRVEQWEAEHAATHK